MWKKKFQNLLIFIFLLQSNNLFILSYSILSPTSTFGDYKVETSILFSKKYREYLRDKWSSNLSSGKRLNYVAVNHTNQISSKNLNLLFKYLKLIGKRWNAPRPLYNLIRYF